MMRTITITLEDADGEADEPTGLHVDRGDGTAAWLASGALDASGPSGSGKTWRQVARRLRDDAAALPAVAPKAAKTAPVVGEFVAGEVAAAEAKP